MRRRDFLCAAGLMALAPSLHAQRLPTPLIGFMSGRSAEDSTHLVAAFRKGLTEHGFIEGQNVAMEFRWANGDYSRLSGFATELVNHRVAVLVAVGGEPSGRSARLATATIPIIFGTGSDPVEMGLVASLNRPGGNATGFTILTNQIEPKRLGVLREIKPGLQLAGILVDSNNPPAERQLRELQQAARTVGQRIAVSKVSNDAELNAAFASLLRQRVDALLVAAAPYFDTRRDLIIKFAAQNRLPTIYQSREYAVAGGLLSYGPSITDAYRQAGVYAARILKGVKPADLPVLQPTKFELVLNLRSAKEQGITIPRDFLARVDEVIE